MLRSILGILILLAGCGDETAGPEVNPSGLRPPHWIASWGDSGAAPGPFSFPSGIACDPSGILFVADNRNHRVKVVRPSGELLGSWGVRGRDDGEFYHPISVAVDTTGVIYVGDNSSRVQRFSAAWQYETTLVFPSKETVTQPTFVDVDRFGCVYVVQSSHDVIGKYAEGGSLLSAWPAREIDGLAFEFLYDLAVGPDGHIYVADSFDGAVHVLSSAGLHVRSWKGAGDEQLVAPTGVDVDHEGRVLVADHDGNAVHVYDSDGGHLLSWGRLGSGPGEFDGPMGICASSNGVIYVTEVGNNRIQVFRW
jgi:sugar lactone lactonase YvrE